jgi:hypothetical protein
MLSRQESDSQHIEYGKAGARLRGKKNKFGVRPEELKAAKATEAHTIFHVATTLRVRTQLCK